MKKIISLGSLVLLIATSMIAGTLAAYSTSLSPIKDDFAAKSFSITANSPTVDDNLDIQIAPGETVDWDFLIRNYEDEALPTEVNMDVEMVLDIPKEFIDYGIVPTLTFAGTEYSLEKVESVEATSAGVYRYVFDQSNVFAANVSKEVSGKLTFNWSNFDDSSAEAATKAIEGVTKGFTVTITGMQASN
jgi:hypothetical protein